MKSSNSLSADDIDETTLLLADKCRYCLKTASETVSDFLKPCKCTNPICADCLKKWIETSNTTNCELCLEKFQVPVDLVITITNPPKLVINPMDYFQQINNQTDQEDSCSNGITGLIFLLVSVTAFLLLFLILRNR